MKLELIGGTSDCTIVLFSRGVDRQRRDPAHMDRGMMQLVLAKRHTSALGQHARQSLIQRAPPVVRHGPHKPRAGQCPIRAFFRFRPS